ncbi:MAG: carboxypeptidase regulatory-like domain-containing protein, partial [Candidatus Eremiobacteraeota bacterium]|nr:carboxypeptidase regulatory-like domain-containing protein [Candidatus Eremiobacteraeota bacterium]
MRQSIAFILSLVCCTTTMLLPAGAQQETSSAISGIVVDQANGLPITGALVETVGPAAKSATTDASGRFALSALKSGVYQLRITHAGYQTTLSEALTLSGGATSGITLALARQQTGATTLREIGSTTVHASQSLQRSSVIYHSASAEAIERSGFYRTGDYLRTLPQVNMASSTGGGSDTPSPGDDQYLDIRGIGNIETTALLDGHPIGQGLNRGKNYGYNWEISPTFALRNVVVTYGSALSGLSPYSAIGGVINMQTLEPTPDRQFTLTQGIGSYAKSATTFSATGQFNSRLGYAVAAGSQSIDGPYNNAYFFQPGAAYDQAAPVGSAVYNMGIYKDDTAAVNRGGMLKLRLSLGNLERPSHLTASALWASYWDDKTGNGDQDFLPYDTALANGQAQLAAYTPGNPTTPPYTVSNLPNCPTGQFLGHSVNGNPFGFGPNGLEDGGPHCVTPQQYASLAGGLQGAGAAWQSFRIGQYDLRFDTPTRTGQIVVEGYTNYWRQKYDRTFQLPFNAATDTSGTGFGPNPYITDPAVSTSGLSITDEFNGRNNDIGLGFAYNNYAYNLHTLGFPDSNPI